MGVFIYFLEFGMFVVWFDGYFFDMVKEVCWDCFMEM